MNMGVENNFSTQLKSLQMDQQVPAKPPETSALSGIERVQKLDLLLHLIVNLKNTLVLRGVVGIGKTALLRSVMTRELSRADRYLINASQALSFEGIQHELLQFVNKISDLESHSLADVLETYMQQERCLVLLVDDAALLVTGLIATLNDFANQYSALRLVFALTPDEYLAKDKEEHLGGYCHFIELPALSIRQCELCIRQLLETESTVYTEKDIDADFVQDIYWRTQGVPGEISRLIKTAKRRRFNNFTGLMMLVTVVVICSAFVSLVLWQEPEQGALGLLVKSNAFSKKVSVVVAESIMEQETEYVGTEPPGTVSVVVEPSPALLTRQVLEPVKSLRSEDFTEKQPTLKTLTISPPPSLEIISTLEKSDTTVSKRGVVKVVKGEAQFPQNLSQIEHTQEIEGRQWLLSQNIHRYTLQLMVLTDKSKVLMEQEKYKKLGYKTFVLEKQIKKGKNYVLFYGSFKSIKEAQGIIQTLPKALRHSWPRRFKAIQKEL